MATQEEKVKAIERIMDDLFGEGQAGEISVDEYVVTRKRRDGEWVYIISKPF